ncbi:MAG: HNH endonuclease [Clostridia bacterium]|nr:HNH endonuclease [Clostridia bacterium]
MKTKRSKACDISQKVKKIVWERDNGLCILCNSSNAMPNAHFIPRSAGGLGIEENIVTLCLDCHRKFDQTTLRPILREKIKKYLARKYENWNEEDLYYKNGR